MYQFGEAGKEDGCLWFPRKVAVVITSGNFIVCDRGLERSRMQGRKEDGHLRNIYQKYKMHVLLVCQEC
jgi:tripartite motif-containing protein 2/3